MVPSGPHPTNQPLARLALADGAVFRGVAFGDSAREHLVAGEVVFNTAMSGYQEALTDPSYAGQILTLTAPMVGVVGANQEDTESDHIQVAGFVVRRLVRRPSNHRATLDLPLYLAESGILGLAGVDTRALTRRLRVEGAMQGVLTNERERSDDELVELARAAPSMAGRNLVPEVASDARMVWTRSMGDWRPRYLPPAPLKGRRRRVLALDCGAKWNILRNLVERGCEVTVAPWNTPASEIRGAFEAKEYDGLFISNGPGDPAAVRETIDALAELLGAPAEGTIPTFGICLGCQLLALAVGAETYKLKFGHRGVNQPVLNRMTGRIEITSQNHGFAVRPESLEARGARLTHVNLNDHTAAGFCLPDRPVFAVQHHPEASPGPHDASYLFDSFVAMIDEGKPLPALGGLG